MAKSKTPKIEVDEINVASPGFGIRSGFGICHLAACVAILLVICCCFRGACGGL